MCNVREPNKSDKIEQQASHPRQRASHSNLWLRIVGLAIVATMATMIAIATGSTEVLFAIPLMLGWLSTGRVIEDQT
jgi:hypothetical protein